MDLILPNGVLFYGPSKIEKTTLVQVLEPELCRLSFFPTCTLEIAKPGSDSVDVKSLLKKGNNL